VLKSSSQIYKEKAMHKNILSRWKITELPFSVLVLFILLWFTYGILFKAPYSGFYFTTSDGQIMEVLTGPQQGPSLQTGDILVKIGDISLAEYIKNTRLMFFEKNKAGDIVDVVVMRNGVELTIPWRFPGFNLREFNGRFFNIWGLAYVFWFFGSVAQLSMRPKNDRWWLFVGANYLTSLWLIFGSLSSRHIWQSSILLHAITWLLLPVYLHLHWVFPHPFKGVPKTAQILFYAACIFLAVAEITQSLPKNWYALAFAAALLGSILLEIIHFIWQPDQRRDISLIAISMFVAFTPSIVLGFLMASGTAPAISTVALLALPFMPLGYFYTIYRHQLGGLEIRVNRFISLYGFMIILGTVVFMFVIYSTRLNIKSETWLFLGPAFMLSTAASVVIGFPAFQSFVEKRLFGIKLPYQNLQESYSSRITTSSSTASLLQLLEDEVFPSLLVRQYAVMQVINGNLKTLLAKNISSQQIPERSNAHELASQAGIYLPGSASDNGWLRLILPLKVGDSFIGFWLLGRRDPDDYYPQVEIPALQSLANQTAIALSNILYAEQLRKVYQSDIERYERERMSLALELHDSVLNELAILRTNLNEQDLTSKFQAAYEEVTQRLREIVSDLRPPMLMYGLIPAIDELADNLMERSGDKVTIKVNIQAGEERLPQNIELHLFRIVQEACQNAMRHAQAKSITVFGTLVPERIDLTIADDGTGFEPQPELGNLIANHHFGLAGMIERTKLIGAEINIQSSPNTGAKINVRWNSNSAMDSEIHQPADPEPKYLTSH
jgi:signal transduction histidine kinase